MPTRESMLRDRTFKGVPGSTAERAYDTLAGECDAPGADEADRTRALLSTARAVAELVKLLEAKGVVTAREVDDLLLSAALHA